MGQIIIKDETLFGEVTQQQRISMANASFTLRDIIVRRVEEEVERRNSSVADRYQFLIDLAPAERRLNRNVSSKIRQRTMLDSAVPIAKAIAAFEANAFFVLVGNRQVDDLEEVIPAAANLEVSFIKLTPLIGG